LKHLKDHDAVKIYNCELDKLNVNSGPLLHGLKQRGEIWFDTCGNFRAVRTGPIDPLSLDVTKKRVRERAPLTPLHKWMRDQLLHVELDAPISSAACLFASLLSWITARAS